MMNQPDLGNYISNLRKEQGLTQEELVEKCNINVRTIQRIEAGEVMPRSYTVKNILEALGGSFDEVFKKEKILSEPVIILNKKFLVYAIIAGIIYFIASTLEVTADTTFSITKEQMFSKTLYVIIKLMSLLAGAVFFYGSMRIGKAYKSPLIILSSASFIIVCLVLGTVDAFIYVHELDAHAGYHMAHIVIYGLLYAFMGASYYIKKNQLGTISKWLGLSGLIGGICLVTIILVLPGIVCYSIFEILLMILMYRLWDKD